MFDYFDGIFPVCRLVEAYQPVVAGGRIKRPTNSFLLFRTWQTKLRKVKEQEEGLSSRAINQNQISGEISVLWQNIPEEVRAYFDQLADELAKEHKRIYPHYMFCPRTKAKEGVQPHTDITKRKKKEKNRRGDAEKGDTPENTPLARAEFNIPSTSPVAIEQLQVPEASAFSMQQPHVGGMASSMNKDTFIRPDNALLNVNVLEYLGSRSYLINEEDLFNLHVYNQQQGPVDPDFSAFTNFSLQPFSATSNSPFTSSESSSAVSPAIQLQSDGVFGSDVMLSMPTPRLPITDQVPQVPQRPRNPFRRNLEETPYLGFMYHL
ncbi:hypothetical protein CVT25_008149 [Psilocybe cyanescens]|uniref:HMG box domain-containing protein n=1 Tax=Psilocybe cyanescens TaxID=93625 RepID=A0A409XSH6_PSICY|nr:hypothetical protein CVT25_008149 [Psilocybe cyanescens]